MERTSVVLLKKVKRSGEHASERERNQALRLGWDASLRSA
jgi:hypothetical protein